MTNSTQRTGLMLIAAMWVGSAAAQDLSVPSNEEAWDVPDLTVPAIDDEVGPRQFQDSSPPTGRPMFAAPHPEALTPAPIENYDAYHSVPHEGLSHGLDETWDGYTAPIESTGTWLRRGFWYAEAEAVVWNRLWNRDDKVFAAEDPNVQSVTFAFNPVYSTNRLLIINGADPGQDTSVRVTLGHFLFRDSHNRDHVAEFTAFGGGDWEQNRRLSSEIPNQLFVPFFIDGGNRSFDESTSQQIDYSSRYASFEGNYKVRWRLARDQLVMDPNGQWHRTANSGWTHEYLAGVRFMENREIFDWRAQDIDMAGNDGEYFIRTDNDMFGFQLGAGFQYETSRWSLGLFSKGGVFVNDALGRTTLNFTADDTSDSDLRLTDDELCFIGEAKLLGRWHVAPNCSLRASYEVMVLSDQALAPYQATFITDFSYLNTTGDSWYHGASFGFECYW